jgi:dethiobiotin synthetase
MSPRVLFVAGAHTEIGKTHIACGLMRAARLRGWAADALKPVVSGFDEDDWTDSDPGRLLTTLARALTSQELDLISPWRFAAPLAPPMAAALERRSLTLGDVRAGLGLGFRLPPPFGGPDA